MDGLGVDFLSIIIRDNIDFIINSDKLMKLLKTDTTTLLAKEALIIAKKVEGKIKAKFILKKVSIEKIEDNYVVIDGITFNSRILAEKLNNCPYNIVFAFIASGGSGTSSYISGVADLFEAYVLDQIAYLSYLSALEAIEIVLEKNFNIKKYISMVPGSINDWHIAELRKIFGLFNGAYRKIDVGLTDGGMMDPVKTTAGLIFQSTDSFCTCEICTKDDCSYRKSPCNNL